ncbi:MAG: helix-turn-helix domain-containing protein [Nitrospirae bacterium]|nr:helix-turn-helix domain-containing protein [Nitrospirota bacterium]
MEKLLDIDDVSEMLGVTKATIYSWTSQNKIPHIKLSKRLLKFREREIMAWVAARTVSASTVTAMKKRGRAGGTTYAGSREDYIEKIIENAKEAVLN